MTPPPAAAPILSGNNNQQKPQQPHKGRPGLTGTAPGRKLPSVLQQEIHEATDSGTRNIHTRHPHQQQHSNTRQTQNRHYQRLSNPFSSSNSNTSSTPRLHSNTHSMLRSPLRASDRYLNSNYRFLVRTPSVSPNAGKPQLSVSSGEKSIDWETVECVVIPTTEDPRCPICLDYPIAPRVTQCGHYFCWTCLLRYLVASVPEQSGGSKNWRHCPVCADQFHQKKVKPVHFFQAMQLKTGTMCEFVLLKRRLTGDLLSAECLQRDLANIRPSPFCKVTELSDSDIVDTVLMPERSAIISRMKAIDEQYSEDGGDGERHFLEQALSLLSDQMQCLSSLPDQQSQPPHKQAPQPHKQPQGDIVFFHQSSDGQYMFLDSLSIKILKCMFGSYDHFPARLHVRINEIEDVGMGREVAKRFKYLAGYVPHGACFSLCEVDLTGVVSDAVLAQFGKEISIRRSARDKRNQREELESRSAARRSSLDDGYGCYWDLEGDAVEMDGYAVSTSYKEDMVNFPPPPGTNVEAPVRPAIWYTREPAVVRPDTPNSSLLFNLSLDDLQSSDPPSSPPNSGGSGGKKGRKFVLIGGTQHRR